jgi:transposase InsO family protein
MEQRYQAVMAVLQDGWKITEVADRLGVTRQAVHKWIARYEAGGLPALADRSHRPNSCSHQIPPALEAMICELRRQHPGWGPRRILHQLGRQGVDPLPGRSSIYRCLKRHNLIELRRRKKRRDEFRRWERDRPMQLWQMDVMSGMLLDDGTDLKIVTGIDDHSRFCVSAGLVRQATSGAVCEVFKAAMLRYGVPDEVLTDNGKVFTGRFGTHKAEVLFDRMCRENGISHRLTAPRSPTTTGKIERFHQSVRKEFLADKTFASLKAAQEALDVWVHDYNNERPHQALEMVMPAQRFRLVPATKDPQSVPVYSEDDQNGQWVLRRVGSKRGGVGGQPDVLGRQRLQGPAGRRLRRRHNDPGLAPESPDQDGRPLEEGAGPQDPGRWATRQRSGGAKGETISRSLTRSTSESASPL